MGVIATPVPTKKRKAVAAADADAASPPSAAGFTNKRVMKKNQKPKSPGAQLVDTVLSSAYHVPQDKAEYKKQITELAEYARSLEESIKNGGKPVLSAIGRKQAASDLKHKIARDIEKAMKWTPSCKTGSARFSVEGVCQDRTVFGELFECSGPPTFKQKKFSTSEFEGIFGDIEGSVRYSSLVICSDHITVHYKDDGTYKFTGMYGKPECRIEKDV